MQFSRAAVFVIALLALRIPSAAGPPQVTPASSESPVFRDFLERVQQYFKLQKSARHLRTTKHREEIVDRRRALAQKIRETRGDAKQGDIFTSEISAEFRAAIRSSFQGPNASNVRKTVRQGEPVPDWHPTVNADYPERLPTTTVPPTLLLRLPQLPSGAAYRIVGHDFVLQDTEARLIIDFIPGAIP